MTTKKLLFLSGVARSGTSALVGVLNTHEKILMGQERYFFRISDHSLSPAHFEKSRFSQLEDGDTHMAKAHRNPDAIARAFDKAEYVGDKFPLLYQHFDYIFDTFPDADHLYVFRNPLSVVESYDRRQRNPADGFTKTWQTGLAEWNESVARVAQFNAETRARFHLVQYEKLFSDTAQMDAMFQSLGLQNGKPNQLQPFVDKFHALGDTPVPRQDDMRQHVAMHADWDSYRKLCRLAGD